MTRTLGTALALAYLAFAPAARARSDRAVVLVVDGGAMRVNVDALSRAIASAIDRPVVRITDERARSASGRLTIAYSNPHRWVLHYEANGQVAWVTDRITRPGALRRRLAELSSELIDRVESVARPGRWSEEVVLALHDEIVDPFEGEPHLTRSRPVAFLWSEVIDPFRDRPPRARVAEVWSEVLDPWAAEVRR